MSRYSSHGKFLLTGEYLVLKWALALALPLKLGQSLEVETLDSNENRLQWDAFRPEGKWFSVTLNRENLVNFSTDDPEKAMRLSQILQAVKQLNPKAFEGNDLRFTTHLDFDPNWGFGSSSTLIANLARWANVNPYELLKLTFGGSGYDIACATAEGPIYYQVSTQEPALRSFDKLTDLQGPQGAKVVEPVETPTPIVEPINFQPSFANHLFFVYQGQKQSSSKEIKAFLAKANPVDLQKDIEAVSEISRAVPKCESLDEFGMLMQCHERIISRCIGQEPVQKRFPDFEGVLKSLGAWGGDFILVATEWDEKQVREYFKGKGLEVIFGYKEVVL
jgi:mevalonate kinase